VLPNTMTPGTDNPSSLHIAAIGDGHDVNHKGLLIGDEVELVHLAAATKSNAKFYPGIEDPYMLVGLDNILGVRTD